MTDRDVVVGVDGGNTKTLAVVADRAGQVLGSGSAGIGDIYGAGSPAAALDEIAAAVGEALDAADREPGDVRAAGFGLAGADWPEDFRLLRNELPARLGIAPEVVVANDAIGALRGGSPAWAGVAIVLGTFNAVGARNADGRVFHLGWWPDSAGARPLGRDGLRAVQRADLGLGPPTRLTALALRRFDVPDPMALLHELTRRDGLPETADGRFAADVLDAADAGDAVALELVERQAEVVSGQARVAAAAVGLGLEGTTVVITGGMLQHPSPLIGERIMARMPGSARAHAVPPPVIGAALLAYDRLGIGADAAALAAGLPSSLSERSAAWAASPSKA